MRFAVIRVTGAMLNLCVVLHITCRGSDGAQLSELHSEQGCQVWFFTHNCANCKLFPQVAFIPCGLKVYIMHTCYLN